MTVPSQPNYLLNAQLIPLGLKFEQTFQEDMNIQFIKGGSCFPKAKVNIPTGDQAKMGFKDQGPGNTSMKEMLKSLDQIQPFQDAFEKQQTAEMWT